MKQVIYRLDNVAIIKVIRELLDLERGDNISTNELF